MPFSFRKILSSYSHSSKPVPSKQAKNAKQAFRSITGAKFLPSFAQWSHLPNLLTSIERGIFTAAFLTAIGSVIALGAWGYATHHVLVPAVGGIYTEALIGTPQFINPLYSSVNDVDQDLVRLVYSGLMKWDPNAGLVTDLAESFSVSADETVYTFALRDGAKWHDDTHVTPRDIIFTFNAIQNPDYKSPLESVFRGVSVEQIDERTVAFTLDEPFAPFLSSLTVGILPAEYWGELDPSNARLAEQNLRPIGSGPYMFLEYAKDKRGEIRSYSLERYPKYYQSPAFIERLDFKFYSDVNGAIDALSNRNVEGLAFAPKNQEEALSSISSSQIIHPSLPQITGLFFNMDHDAVKNLKLRQGLATAINKETITELTLGGGGAVTHSPILSQFANGDENYKNPHPFNVSKAREIIEASGWSYDNSTNRFTKGSDDNSETLELTITTVDQPETVAVASKVSEMWLEAGVPTQVSIIDTTRFRDEILQSRDYDILLTGILMNGDPDPYPFWHSSQQGSGGLNLSQYANREADTLIQEARGTNDRSAREKRYAELTGLINESIPAIFLYQPTYTYVSSKKIRGIMLDAIVNPSDRFGQINEWFIRTKRRLQFR